MPRRAVLAAAAVMCVLSGCARTTIEHPLDTNYRSGDTVAEIEFLEALSQRSAVSNDEALHALFVLSDGEDINRSYEARVEEAKRRGWLSPGFDEAADLAVQRGTVARAVCVLCGIKGGVIMRLAGPVPRYAQRELVYLEIMAPSTGLQTISGRELVGVLTKAQEYLGRREAGAPRLPHG
jgi:hypothetical protein